MNTIPVLKPSCTDREIELVTQVLRSGWWGQGPVVEQFEALLAKRYVGMQAVTVNSATAALHLALVDLDVGPGDEVILPAMTFVSTGLAVLYCGAKPVFADIKPDTLTLDWVDVSRKITVRTKAIIPVDYAGYPALDWCECVIMPNDLPLVQDAAHSCGGRQYGDRICFSFHPVKNLATGDGGAILTYSKESVEHLRALRWCGIDRSTYQRTGKTYAWDYDIQEVGYKAHWNDVQAAIGLAQLERLDDLNARRREVAERYTTRLAGKVVTPVSHHQHTWHLYVIQVEERERLIDALAAEGISTGVHYKPLTHYPIFEGDCPVTEAVWTKLLTLPVFYDLSNEQVDFICDKLLSVL